VAFADGKGDKPSAAVIDRAIAQYLDGIRFKNGESAGVTWRRSVKTRRSRVPSSRPKPSESEAKLED